jgi:hypothetical protein
MRKAPRAEARFRVRYETEITETRVFVIYETSGWTTQQIALDYLEWLAEHVTGHMVLLWDLFATHCDEVVDERVSTLCVRFVFVSSGMAGRSAPLDKRIFKSMKRRVTWWPEEVIACAGDADCIIEVPVASSLNARNAITHGKVTGSWDQSMGVNQICAEV